MMPPDTSPVPQEPLRATPKDSKTPFPYPSRVRNLLGLPNSGAVPLLSTTSLPMVDLPYITSQMGVEKSAPQSWGGSHWTDFELGTPDNQDGEDIEPLLSDSSPHLPPPQVSELPQKTSSSTLDLKLPGPSNSLPLSVSSDSSLVEEENLSGPPTSSELKTTASSDKSFLAPLAGGSMPENHYLANPSSERTEETKMGIESESELTESSKLTPVDENSENPRSVLRSTPQPTSIMIPGLTPPRQSWQEGERVRSEYQTVNNMAAQIEKLETIVADLSAQVAAQKDFQQPVPPIFPQPSQPQVIIQQSESQPKAPQAFWERSYVHRLYRWSHK